LPGKCRSKGHKQGKQNHKRDPFHRQSVNFMKQINQTQGFTKKEKRMLKYYNN